MAMSGSMRELSFCWWNLHNFAHYDNQRSGLKGWPKSLAEYEAKKARIMQVLDELFPTALPDLLAICEITPKAAWDLGESLKNVYVAITATSFSENAFQVAVLHRNAPEFKASFPFCHRN